VRDQQKTKAQLIQELAELRQGLAGLEEAAIQREDAQTALEEQRQRLFGLLDALPAVVYLQAPDYSIPFANRLFREIHGEPGGRPCYAVLHAREAPCEECHTFGVFVTGESQVRESIGPGTGPMYQVHEHPFTDADGSTLVLVVATDISKRKRAERALKEYSARLEEMVDQRTAALQDAQAELVNKERLAILGELAAGVSHELRNPLATITNAVYFLQMTLTDADDTTKEYLQLIAAQVQSAGKIVSDLLDFSRPATADRQATPLPQLVAQLWERCAPPENVEVAAILPANLPPLFVDPHQLGQVLENLVTNAYQAMPRGGDLTIEGRAGDDEVHISIADTGVGIATENMDRLFQPLFSTKPRGIGLGLAVSRTLVEANGGSIKVESKEGEGSMFTLVLPAAGRQD
jgi:signal transduction histidine kinase